MSPLHEDLKKTVKDQSLMIESLKTEKLDLSSSLTSLKADHEKIAKENQILRRAVTIQQERYQVAENDLKTARRDRLESDERIRVLEQLILSLRYHLQAQQTHVESDFLNQRPPNVY
jgi:chromosome segregation ATPase